MAHKTADSEITSTLANASQSIASQAVQTKVIEMTPTKALKWLREFHFKGQRPLSKPHIAYLAGQMKRGNFKFTSLRLTGIPTDKMGENGEAGTRWFLTNGQHTLHALVESGSTLSVGVQFVRVRTMREVREDYAEQDNGRLRSLKDTMSGLEAGKNFDLKPQQVTQTYGALRVILSGFALRSKQVPALKSRVEGAAQINAWAPTARSFFEIVAEAPNAILLKSPSVMAVALATLEAETERANHFWCGIAHDDGLRAGDPRRTLLYFLRQTPARDRAALLLGCAQAWAAWCEERELTKIEFSRDAVFSLLGTPWEAK